MEIETCKIQFLQDEHGVEVAGLKIITEIDLPYMPLFKEGEFIDLQVSVANKELWDVKELETKKYRILFYTQLFNKRYGHNTQSVRNVHIVTVVLTEVKKR